MKKCLSILSLLLLFISLTSLNHAQETGLLATEVLIPTYDNKFLVGVKYSDSAQRFKIKGVYDKGGKKLEGKFAGYVNPIAAEYLDLKKLSVATDKRTVWNLEQDLIEDSKSTTIINQTDSGVVMHYGNSYTEFPASGYYGFDDDEMKQVIVRFYLDEDGNLITYNIIKEGEKLCSEVAILKLNDETIFLKEGAKLRELTDYETQNGEKHYVHAIRGSDGILKVMSNYFGEFQLVPFHEGHIFNLEEFMSSK